MHQPNRKPKNRYHKVPRAHVRFCLKCFGCSLTDLCAWGLGASLDCTGLTRTEHALSLVLRCRRALMSSQLHHRFPYLGLLSSWNEFIAHKFHIGNMALKGCPGTQSTFGSYPFAANAQNAFQQQRHELIRSCSHLTIDLRPAILNMTEMGLSDPGRPARGAPLLVRLRGDLAGLTRRGDDELPQNLLIGIDVALVIVKTKK